MTDLFESQIIKELFPAINRMYVNGCGIRGWHSAKEDFTPGRVGAHTHMCRLSKTYRTICFTDREFIFNPDGSPSDLIWHEYGHILDEKLPKGILKCLGYDNKHEMKTGFKWDQHGETFAEVMIKLGRPDLSSGGFVHYPGFIYRNPGFF